MESVSHLHLHPSRTLVVSLLAAVLLCCCTFAHAEADNRYCKPGNQPAFGANDGPAALPQSCFYTALSATPSPGKTTHPAAGEDLQHAVNTAHCGDTVELPAGATFKGSLLLPSKHCDDDHWITIKSDGNLPPEGTRITPCYAGLSSLPGRPQYPCSSPSKAMPVLLLPPRGQIKITDHYRLIGLEITRETGGPIVYNLITAQNGAKIVLDRVWVHGTESDETTRGMAFPGATFIAVIDSYFSDFHCTAATGECVDSQALWAGVGPVAGGTYKIVNNYLEAAGENILMGGGAGSATPADMEIRRNHFFKPLSWHVPSGRRFIVKNSFELKNGQRVLVEGNVFENSWGGFSQAGFQILLTPKSQGNKCPQCIVRDITLRYCVLSQSGAGLQLASDASDAGGLTQGLMNVSIHDLVILDINARNYSGNGVTFQISTAGGAFHDLSIRHVTVPVSDKHLILIGGRLQAGASQGIVLTENVLGVGQYPVMSTGGRNNCAFGQISPKDMFDACWKGYQATANLLVGGADGWPHGNRSVKNLKALGYGGAGSDANELAAWKLPASNQNHAAVDGADYGADIPKIQAVIAGRE
jgi:hypothetical protein